ncbi:hypothetical protein ACVWXM_006761 [Bradyrhizobium sp. GM7.3]
MEENIVLAGITAPKCWLLDRIYEMFWAILLESIFTLEATAAFQPAATRP